MLNLGVTYHYDANTKSDKVQVADGVTLDFTNTSSGLQSVIPLYVHLNYLKNINADNTGKSLVERQENEALLDIIYKELFLKKGKVGDIEKVNGIVTSIIL